MFNCRKAKTLTRFFNQLSAKQRKSIEAVAIDMRNSYIKAVKKLSNAHIVFDLFHIVTTSNRAMGKIRNSEYRKAAKENKDVFKGSKYLLLKNLSKVRTQQHHQQLKQLLEFNEVINTVMILKDQLKHIWTDRSRNWACKMLDRWCALARSLNHHALNSFARMLQQHSYDILKHCDYPIHTGKLEGVNNKIKVIRRKVCSFHYLSYFILKIYQAFCN